MESSRRKHIIGITLGLLAGLTFNIGPCITKTLITLTTLSGSDALLIRGVSSLFCISIVMTCTKTPLYKDARNLLPGAAIGLSAGIALLFCYVSLEYISAGTTGIIWASLSPFTALFGFAFLREKCRPLTLLFGFLSLCGIALVLAPEMIIPDKNHVIVRKQPEFLHKYVLGIVFAFCAVGSKIFCLILMKKTLQEDNEYKRLVLYQGVGYIVASFIGMLSHLDAMSFPTLSWLHWLMLIVAGIASCLGVFLQSASLLYESAGIVSFLVTTEVIWAYAYDVLIAHQIPNKYSVIGIVVAVTCIALLMLNRVFQFDKKLFENVYGHVDKNSVVKDDVI